MRTPLRLLAIPLTLPLPLTRRPAPTCPTPHAPNTGTVKLVADKADNYLKFSLVVSPTDGYWAGAQYEFKFTIPDDYPWGAPSVTLADKIWHPNIDLQGKPCVNVLQKNWKPTFTIQTVVFGILFLFSDPNPLDPLNNGASSIVCGDRRVCGVNDAVSKSVYACVQRPRGAHGLAVVEISRYVAFLTRFSC